VMTGAIHPMRWPVLLAGLLLCLSACAPQLQPPSFEVAQPSLATDALVMDDGEKLPLRSWLPEGHPKAVIVALHGFNDYSQAFAEPAAFWASQGIATYAYDQRGFGATPHRGLWAGDPRMMQDVRQAVALIRARHPGVPVYLLGESMGGALALAVADSSD